MPQPVRAALPEPRRFKRRMPFAPTPVVELDRGAGGDGAAPQASAQLAALRREDLRGPVAAAYLATFELKWAALEGATTVY